jgi:hypothetical protein
MKQSNASAAGTPSVEKTLCMVLPDVFASVADTVACHCFNDKKAPVIDAEISDVVALIGGSDFRLYTVERNPEIESRRAIGHNVAMNRRKAYGRSDVMELRDG